MDNAVHAKGRRGETQRGDYNFASFAHYLRGLCVKTLWCIMYYYQRFPRLPEVQNAFHAKGAKRNAKKSLQLRELSTP